MYGRVLILGARGRVGRHCCAAFEAAGWDCRRFDRSADDMSRAAQGCDVIVNGLNPPNYHNWAGIIPKITAEVIAAARTSGATVILPGNVYPFGRFSGVIDENTPHAPCSRKGQIRTDMERAYRASGVQVINLRAGDFIDPERGGDVFSLMVTRGMKRGKVGLMGAHDAVHAWAFLPDWARAVEGLAQMRGALAVYEDIPFSGHALTAQELRVALEAVSKRGLRFQRFPWWSLRLSAPFWELARELLEMRYLWDVSHELSSERLSQLLPDFRATPLPEVLRRSCQL